MCTYINYTNTSYIAAAVRTRVRTAAIHNNTRVRTTGTPEYFVFVYLYIQQYCCPEAIVRPARLAISGYCCASAACVTAVVLLSFGCTSTRYSSTPCVYTPDMVLQRKNMYEFTCTCTGMMRIRGI